MCNNFLNLWKVIICSVYKNTTINSCHDQDKCVCFLSKMVKVQENDDTIIGGRALISASWEYMLRYLTCQSYMVLVTNDVILINLCPCCLAKPSCFFLIVHEKEILIL